MIERLSKMSCIERTSNLSRASCLRRSRYLTFLPIYAILPDSTNAMNGSSKPRNFYRELPDGERRVQNFCEYIPELRTESGFTDRLRRNSTRYCAEVILYRIILDITGYRFTL